MTGETIEQIAPSVIDTKLEHSWKNYPDFGNLHYEKQGDKEVLTIKGETGIDLTIEDSPQSFGFRLEQPAKWDLNDEYPNNLPSESESWVSGKIVYKYNVAKG